MHLASLFALRTTSQTDRRHYFEEWSGRLADDEAEECPAVPTSGGSSRGYEPPWSVHGRADPGGQSRFVECEGMYALSYCGLNDCEPKVCESVGVGNVLW